MIVLSLFTVYSKLEKTKKKKSSAVVAFITTDGWRSRRTGNNGKMCRERAFVKLDRRNIYSEEIKEKNAQQRRKRAMKYFHTSSRT